jgi:hypothetical protein
MRCRWKCGTASIASSGYVQTYAETIAGNAPLTVRAVKRITCELAKEPGARDLELCDALVAECYASDDHWEGRPAFRKTQTRVPRPMKDLPVRYAEAMETPNTLVACLGKTRPITGFRGARPHASASPRTRFLGNINPKLPVVPDSFFRLSRLRRRRFATKLIGLPGAARRVLCPPTSSVTST